jgi:glycosyltransferase involved in cell wall biosynthesis
MTNAGVSEATLAPSGKYEPLRTTPRRHLRGKRAAVVVFSYYPADPRPRRAAEALVREGMSVDVVCLREDRTGLGRETVNGVNVRRVPLRRRRGGVLGYVLQYVSFLAMAGGILAVRSLRGRYHLVHVHNMPDVLVLSALVPKVLGAKVILDLHDPMPELMTTIFGLDAESWQVRMLRRLERWSIGWADLVLTVNLACKRLFFGRSCEAEKIHIVMNSPDEAIFAPGRARSRPARRPASGKAFVVMYHGSLVERNGLDLAVEAVARVRGSVPSVELRIYGPGTPFLERVMESVRSRGLTDTIRYLGPKRLEEIASAIETCDVGIVPNQRSVFAELNTPTRIFEYLAVGTPVVAPRAAGILDYFQEDSLVLFELGDADDLARRLEYVWAEPDKVREIVRRGRDVYRSHAWSREREVLIGLVDELVGEGARR